MILEKLKEKSKGRLKDAKGFTLVEMIVVLAIIGILIALIAPNVAKLIGNAQETSDTGKAKSIMTAAQAYATDAVGGDYQLGVHITTPPTGLIMDQAKTYAMAILTAGNGDAAMRKLFYASDNSTAFDKPFMDGSGDALIQEGTIGASDAVYIYFSPKGAVMGVVYCGGPDDKTIKAVTGTKPVAVAITPNKKFNNVDLVGGKIDIATGNLSVK